MDPGRLSRASHPSNHAGKWMYKDETADTFLENLTPEWNETRNSAHVPLHTIFPRKIIFTHRTGPIHVNSMEAQSELRKNENVLPLYRFQPRL